METEPEIINKVKKGDKEVYGIIVKKYMKKAYFLKGTKHCEKVC